MSRDDVAQVRQDSAQERPWRERFNDGLRAGISFGIIVFVLAISFGIVARPILGVVAPIVMSAVIFAGSSQYAAIAVLAAGGGPITAILAGVLVGARYIPMGIALAPSLEGGLLRRAAVGQAIIDLSWVAASRRSDRPDPAFMIGATLPSYPLWVLGTAIGVLGGGLIGEPDRLGLDALIPAVFLALLFGGGARPGRQMIAAALLGAAVALALFPVAPAGVPVIASCLGALVGLAGPPKGEPALGAERGDEHLGRSEPRKSSDRESGQTGAPTGKRQSFGRDR